MAWPKGRRLSLKHRRKIAKGRRGKTHDDVVRQQIRLTHEVTPQYADEVFAASQGHHHER